ncbi:outer membrane usher protein [Rahnella aquatilis]|nr:fimbria/pilus outer membrane usher protein [Rahnella aquatilis]RBQ34280.1 outer membrane usher protein [Rahnella aquatilis]
MSRMKLSLLTLSVFVACNSVYAADISEQQPILKTDVQDNKKGESEGVEFNEGFLSGYGIDISKFNEGNPVIPGHYIVRFITNDVDKGDMPVDFIDTNKDGVGDACLTPVLLKQAGIKDAGWDKESEQEEVEETRCIDLKKYIPTARWNLDVNTQTFKLDVPQVNTFVSEDGTVDPELWQNGINAVLLDYNFNAYSTKNDAETSRTVSGNYNGGINLGAWRFRTNAYSNWSEESGSTFDTGDYYLERDIAFLRGQVRLGNAYSDGQLFDSFNVNGLTLKSDDRMLPFSQQGFFPVIRGVAESNAKVKVKQNDYVIYETTVPPGAFEFSNIRSGNVGTDIQVEVTEADGRVKTFVVPYSTSSQMLRPGVFRYNFTVGEYDAGSTYSDKPLVAQGTWQQGLSNTITAYGGLQGTESYWAAVVGGTLNTSIGAFSFDVTNSNTQIPTDKTYNGQSYELSYDQFIDATKTNFQLAAYRYSTSGYFSLSDAMDYIYDDNIDDLSQLSRSRNKFQINISQALPQGYGSLYLNGSVEDYWDAEKGKNTQYQMGYSNTWSKVSYSISASKYYDGTEGRSDTQLYVNLSIPLDWSNGKSATPPVFDSLNVGYGTNNKHETSTNVGANGYRPENEFSYGVNAYYNTTRDGGQDISSVSGNSSINTRFSRLGGTATRSNDGSQQVSMSVNGGLVGHSGGITFAPDISLNGPMALIEAKGASGSKVQNGSAKVDGNGYALATNLSPYIENKVALDISTMEGDAEMKGTMSNVIPHDGSIVRVKFDTDERRFVMFVAKRQKDFIPLGADVYNEAGEHIGNAAQGGKLLTRGASDKGELTVRWGEDAASSCRVSYQLPPEVKETKPGETATVEGLVCQ